MMANTIGCEKKMQNLRYMEKILEDEKRFGVVLNEIASKHTEHIKLQMALSLLEFFNGGNSKA